MKPKSKNKAESGKRESGNEVAPPLQEETRAIHETPTSGEFKRVPRTLLRPDPNQPRKDFSEAQLMEMAVSMYLQGIIQPLVVKRVPALRIKEPDMIEKNWQAVDEGGSVVFEGPEENVKNFAAGKLEEFYQIIAGERRWRSTEARALEIDGRQIDWPGLKELPVMVREADDRATFALQHIENQKRVNLSALEEAHSFGRELQQRRAADPAFLAEKLGEELGIKRGTVYNLMKLLRLKEPVRQALIAGKIETSHARAIASVPDIKRQEELLLRVVEDADYGEDMLSVRALEELIDNEYVKQLKDGPFDKEEESLVPPTWQIVAGQNEIAVESARRPAIPNLKTIGTPKVVATGSLAPADYGKLCVVDGTGYDMTGPLPKKKAKELAEFLVANVKAGAVSVSSHGGGACTVCPHRSGVMDPATKTPNVCTLPSCFDAKVKAHWVRKSEALTAAGTPVLTEGQMRKLGKHIPEDRHNYTQNKSGNWKELMGKHAPDPVLVATKEGIKKFYPAEDAVAAAKKNGVKFYNDPTPKKAEDKAVEEKKRKEKEKLQESRRILVNGLVEKLVPGLNQIKDAAAWKLLLEQQRDPYHGHTQKLVKLAKGDRAKVLAHLMGEELFRTPTDWETGNWQKETLKLWEQLGVDLPAEEKKADAALPMSKPESQQKQLLEVKQKGPKKMSAAARAKIVAAAKARWAKVKAKANV